MTSVEVPTSNPDLEGFQYVKKKASPRNNRKKTLKGGTGDGSATTPLLQLAQRYEHRRDVLLKSDFYKDFRRLILDLLETSLLPPIKRMKMMGIGTLTHNPSLTQLALGLDLAGLLHIPSSRITTSDPMYTALDRSFLATLHITVQDISAGNMHDTSEPLLLFAPHVPKSVYEASMRQFWRQSHIGHLVLLANDVRHYPDIYSDERMRRESPCLLAASTLIKSIILPQTFEHNNVFNDLAVQWFERDVRLPDLKLGEGHEIEEESFETNQDEVQVKQ